MIMNKPSIDARGYAALAWQTEETKNLPIDMRLLDAVARLIDDMWKARHVAEAIAIAADLKSADALELVVMNRIARLRAELAECESGNKLLAFVAVDEVRADREDTDSKVTELRKIIEQHEAAINSIEDTSLRLALKAKIEGYHATT